MKPLALKDDERKMPFPIVRKETGWAEDSPEPGSKISLCFVLTLFRNRSDMPAHYSITVILCLKTSLFKYGDMSIFSNYTNK